MLDEFALHSTAWEGNVSRLSQLVTICILKSRINETDADYGHRTAIHIACERGHLRCSEILLENGADPSLRMYQGWTPAHCAAENGNLKILKLLLEHNGLLIGKDDYGATPKNIAETYGRSDCVEFLNAVEKHPSQKHDIIKEKITNAARRSLLQQKMKIKLP